ncbi:SDR family oxidoreductase [Microbispora siamensis]|uniref:Short-chain dehydrogenase n=1 Tax=Microbispora siamensis TaxID=564413 RepID=A0ABQ4GZA1_9ACTN|nr:SDR family oxidoreductase [Microbispora siamensis]GIH66727.1 short-chain dehydrogenase [Microbispora siamensis]
MPGADLAGSVAVVTGASGRLGTLWCATLLDAGADVMALDLVEPGEDGLGPRTAGAGRYLPFTADVTDRRSLEHALDACLDRLGPPTILVNNAGIDSPPTRDQGSWLFGDIPEELSAIVLDVNALGVLRVCQVFGSHMAQRRTGTIVNIGSLYGGLAPYPPLYDHLDLDPPFLKPPAYGMSKAGVAALTRYLAALWGPKGVRVNTLSPGGVLGDQDPQFKKKFSGRVPLGRMAYPEDLTGPLLFLVSDMSRYVTGQEMLVDGGYSCW